MPQRETIRLSFLYLLFLSIFLLPRINGIDYSSILMALLGSVAIYYRFSKNKQVISNFEKGMIVFLGMVFVNTLYFCNFKFNEDWYYFLRILRSYFLFYIIFGYTIFFKIEPKKIMKQCWVIGLIHLLLVLFQYFANDNLKIFFLSLNPVYNSLINPAEFQNVLVGGVRVKGVMMGFDGAGVLIAIWAMLSMSLFKSNRPRLIIITISVMASFLTSRTGVLLTSQVLILYLFITAKDNIKFFLKTIFYFFTLSLFGYVLVTSVGKDTNLTKKTLPFMLEGLISYEKSGRFKIASLEDTLFNHTVVLKSDLTLFGRPEKQKPAPGNIIKNATQSDVGYIQLLGNIGMVGFLVVLSVLFKEVLNAYKETHTIFDLRILLILLIMVANIKGPYFFGRLIFDFIVIIIALKKFNNMEKDFFAL